MDSVEWKQEHEPTLFSVRVQDFLRGDGTRVTVNAPLVTVTGLDRLRERYTDVPLRVGRLR